MNDLPTYVWTEDLNASAEPQGVGGKALNLFRLRRMGQPVPPWFAISTMGFHAAIRGSDLDRDIAATLADIGTAVDRNDRLARLRNRIAEVPLPADLLTAIHTAHASTIRGDAFLAVRSSACDEDSASQSFAGLHDSFLFVRGEAQLLAAIRKVWASAYNDRAIAYRLERGLRVDDISIAVVVQTMIDARVSGVMFTVNPVSGNVGEVVISSLFGAGEGLVSAGLDADTFTVTKATLAITTQLADKTEQVRFDRESGAGVKKEPVPERDRQAPSLPPPLIERIARAGLAIERAYAHPQDIEFSVTDTGELFFLQSRPVTTVEETGPAAGNHLIWDNSNIIESYSGVTSPMTFSFIRRAYTIVYHCFSTVMGIPPSVVQANRHTFENMLGLIRGQVYYNLLNWYRLVRLFPGFAYNKAFMESMMGVKEPAELKDEYVAPGFWRRYFVELPRLIRLLARSTRNFAGIRSKVRQFEDNFNRRYTVWSAMDFDRKSPHELMAIYREMEDSLLWNWKAPIINDFFVMIFYGILKTLCVKWCGDQKGSLQNDLICGEGGIESTQPTKLLLSLATMAQANPRLRDLILREPAETLVKTIPSNPEFAAFSAGICHYLDLYGFRCMNELKLEEFSLHDRPQFLYTVIRNYLALDRPEALDPALMETHEQAIRGDAERRAEAALGPGLSGLIRKPVFRWVLANARLGVKNRENMRFARTKIYGLLRKMIRALGGHLVREGVLKDREDIFYLTLDECWDFVKGTAVTTNLAALAALRQVEFTAFREEKERLPDDRFDTYGMAYHRNRFKAAGQPVARSADGILRGIGCSPGEVTGIVKVLLSPRDDLRLSGEILVAERTDPGWVPLYPSVSALLIERGSILSHSAIVAREMGIPTIVGIPGLTALLKSGQRVRMNGSSGTVEILNESTGE